MSHSWHLCRFSNAWILLCCTRSPDTGNRLVQTVHSNGFSPEWLCLCPVKWYLLLKHFPHSVHLYLLLWTFMWCFKQCWVVKRFSHWVHEYNLSPWCVCLCRFKLPFCVNRLSHTVHKYGLGLSSCGCSVMSLLSASNFTSNELSPATKYSTNVNKQVTFRHLAALLASSDSFVVRCSV